MTREGLARSGTMLKSVPASPRNEALASIQKLVELKLPFTESNFRSLLGVRNKRRDYTQFLRRLKIVCWPIPLFHPQAEGCHFTALDKMAKPFVQATGGALLGQSLLTILDQNRKSRKLAFPLCKC